MSARPNKPPKPLPFPSVSFTFFPRIVPYQGVARATGPGKKNSSPLFPGQSRVGPGVRRAGMIQKHHGALILSLANSMRERQTPKASLWEVPRRLAFGLSAADRSPIARSAPPAVFTHLRSPRGSLPQLAGEGGAKRRMGCGPLVRPKSACTNVTANLRRTIPAFRTPSGLRPPSPLRGEGETRHREQSHQKHREFDLCERRSGAPARRSRPQRAPAALRRSKAVVEASLGDWLAAAATWTWCLFQTRL